MRSLPRFSDWTVAPISPRVRALFLASVAVMFLHKVECWLTDEWLVSPFFQWLVSLAPRLDPDPAAALGEAMFLVFVVWLFAGLVMGGLLMRGGAAAWAALAIWGLTFGLEWHHVARAIARGGYYPGLVTAAVYLPLMAVFWRALLGLVQVPPRADRPPALGARPERPPA